MFIKYYYQVHKPLSPSFSLTHAHAYQMSGGVADQYLVFLLQTLKEEWRDYKNLKDGAKHEFDELKRGLGELEAFLRDAAVKSDKSQHFRKRESEIRELVYDVEDTIEVCSTKVAAAKTQSWFKRSFKTISTEMEQKVKLIRRERVQPTLDAIRLTGEAEKNNESSSILEKQLPEVEMYQSTGKESSQDQTGSMQDKIVDFQDEDIIIGYLKEEKQQLDVIAVTGMAGMGKTTFARKIFQNKEITDIFPRRIWMDVSEKFNRRNAF